MNPVPIDDVTIIGHSLGGYSALRLAGATPTNEGVQNHCDEHTNDPILCSETARSRIDNLADNLADNPSDLTEPAIDRVVLLTPGYGPLFSDTELQNLQIPSMTVRADTDTELVGDQVQRLQQLLPETESINVKGGHFVFLRTCTPEEQSDLPELCEDPDGVDRSTIQTDLATQIVDFATIN